MRWSQTLIPTAREAPSEAESPGQKLLVRGGFIRRLGAGLYNYLPLGLRVIRKIEGIIREEMAASGADELLMPVLQPRELWEKSGRWNSKDLPMLTLANRSGQEFVLAPTHEEVITALAAAEIKSYKDLPGNLFQIQAKFRDELRPRFGLIRAREFIMKDGYSFDRDAEASAETYRKMESAYGRIFSRCGLDVRKVLADPGAMGGGMTHEFMAPAEIGEDTIIKCGSCPYASNMESAKTETPSPAHGGTPQEVQAVNTPGMKTVEQLSGFLKIPRAKFIKTLIYEADGVPCAALVRGDREINELKLRRLLGASEVSLAGEKTIREATGGPRGFSGPRGLKEGIKIIADSSIPGIINAVAGANLPDKHFLNINAVRDFRADETADISFAAEGDPCPECGRPLEILKGIEVGQVFNLGTKYSEALGASFLDAGGKEKPCIMGCYGIGVSRTMAAAAEQNRDEKGIVWPREIAPFSVLILPVNLRDEKIRRAAEEVYANLTAGGADTLLDDRDLRAGVKFNDADLTGIPWRITAGKKAPEGIVEIHNRKTGETEEAGIEEAAGRLAL